MHTRDHLVVELHGGLNRRAGRRGVEAQDSIPCNSRASHPAILQQVRLRQNALAIGITGVGREKGTSKMSALAAECHPIKKCPRLTPGKESNKVTVRCIKTLAKALRKHLETQHHAAIL